MSLRLVLNGVSLRFSTYMPLCTSSINKVGAIRESNVESREIAFVGTSCMVQPALRSCVIEIIFAIVPGQYHAFIPSASIVPAYSLDMH